MTRFAKFASAILLLAGLAFGLQAAAEATDCCGEACCEQSCCRR